MSAEAFEFMKTVEGTLLPADDRAKIKTGRLAEGEIVLAVLRRPRNIRFHRKAMAMLRFAFDNWNPLAATMAGLPAEKSFNVFRREVTIQAGYYDVVLGLDGEARLEAQSLAFDNMDEETFVEVYSAVYAVLAGGILQGMTAPEAQHLANALQLENF